MDEIRALIETLGFPVASALGLGFVIWKIMTKQFANLYDIVVKLIDAKNRLKESVDAMSAKMDTIIKFIQKD